MLKNIYVKTYLYDNFPDGEQKLGRKRAYLKTFAVWAAILFLVTFNASLLNTVWQVVNIIYYPTLPQEGQPIVIMFTIKNFDPNEQAYGFWFYVDGVPIMTGTTVVSAGAYKQFKYITISPGMVGKSMKAYVRVQSLNSHASYEKQIQIPPYPPEIWSSFSSFATFSSTLMGYMTTLSYYMTTMDQASLYSGLNMGLTFSLTLIGLLVFLELSDPTYGKIGTRVLNFRKRYGLLTVALLIIFISMVLTKIVLIISGVG